MLKFLFFGIVGFLLVASFCAQADHTFCCNDSNWQQDLFENFQMQGAVPNLSTPPGIYNKVCSNCSYDLNMLRCDCKNDAGQVFYNAQMKVGDCQTIYGDIRGNLRCGD